MGPRLPSAMTPIRAATKPAKERITDHVTKTVEASLDATALPRPPLYAGGPFSKTSAPSASVIQGCLLRLQMCRVGRSQDVSSSVPARTRIRPSLAGPAIQEPHSGQTHRVLVRPLSASR
jgi:hypothetical protein